MSFYFFAWLASIFYGIEAVIGKLISKYTVKNPWLFNFIWSGITLVLIGGVSIYSGIHWPVSWPPLLLAALFYALGGLLYIVGIYYFDISALSPMYNFRTVFSVILAALMLGEVLTSYQYGLIALIFLAGIFVTMDERFSLKSFFSWPMLIVMGDMVGLALMGIYIQKAMVANDFWTVTFYLALLSQVLYLVTIPLFWRDLKSLAWKHVPGIFWMALAGFIATLAANKAYSLNVGISATIISLPLSMFMAFALSYLFPDLLEKHPNRVYIVRFGAAAVMFASAILLSR